MEKRRIPRHDKSCGLWQGKRCTCFNNPHLTEKCKKELKEKGVFDKLFIEDIES